MTPSTRRFGLIGDPVDHSLSPRMHTAGFAAIGVDAEYVLVRVPADAPEAVERQMRRLAALGGGNVTLPHKRTAARALERSSEAVRATGACNCFWLDDEGRLAGDNTDVPAIRRVLEELAGGRTPADVLVLGAGGAGAAAALAAARLGARLVRIANRTPARADRLAARLAELGFPARAEAWPAAGTCDLVVNATSLGLRPSDPPPASFDRLIARAALDLVYGAPPAERDAAGESRSGTSWTRAAAARGIPATDGLEVLLRQGGACYPRWFGVEAPIDALWRGLAGGAG